MYNSQRHLVCRLNNTPLFLEFCLTRSMKTVRSFERSRFSRDSSPRDESSLGLLASCAIAAVLALFAFYLSLVASSAPLSVNERLQVQAAIKVLEAKGFSREAFLLRHTVTYRSTDNWLNSLTKQDNAYAATNFPFQIITIYPDFYYKAADDTERAMVLLHESQHLQGKDEAGAYGFVWQHREQLGWTQIKYGSTPSYVTIAEQTHDYAPEMFTCPNRVWNDCTESIASAQPH
jgi:hypothetical protein